MKKNLTVLAAACAALAVAAPAHADVFSGPSVTFDLAYETGHQDSFDHWETDEGDYGDYHENGAGIRGFAGGIAAGYDMRLGGKFFGGVELRAAYSDAKYKSTHAVVIDDSDLDRHGQISYRERESVSATARVGYVLNENTGIYVRGGVARAQLKANNDYGFPVAYDPIEDEYILENKASERNTGYVLGAGLETTLSQKLALRAEYAVTSYGAVYQNLMDKIAAAEEADYGDPAEYGLNYQSHQVRVGLSYRF